MIKWEYTVLTLEVWTEGCGHGRELAERDALLSELGHEGWELVTVIPLELTAISDAGGTTHERWVFKRPANLDGSALAAAQAAVEDNPAASEPSDAASLTGLTEIVRPRQRDDGS